MEARILVVVVADIILAVDLLHQDVQVVRLVVSVVVVVLARADVMVSVGHLVAVHVGLAVWEVAKVVADRLVKRDVL